MPGLKVALNSGSWSDTSIWSGGVKPSAGDTVCANGYTIILDENINVGTLTTAAQSPVTAVPTMTSYNTPRGIVTTSGDQSPSNPAWRAFDGGTSLTPSWYTNNTNTGWLAYEFTSSIVIDGYGMSLRGDGYDPRNWTFEGWDGASWVILHTVSGSSGTTFYRSPVLNNNTAYIKYRYNITANNNVAANLLIVLEAYMYERYYANTGSVGGGFILNNGINATCTAATGIAPGTTTCLTYSGTGSATLNAVIGAASTAVASIIHSGGGVLNVNGNLNNPGTSVSSRYHILVNSSGSLNYTGTNGGMQVSYAIYMSGNNSKLTHIGDLYGTQIGGALYLAGSGVTSSITGNLIQAGGGSLGGGVAIIQGSNCRLDVVGNLGNSTLTATSIHNILSINAAATVNITGNCYGNASGYAALSTSAAAYVKIIGTMYAGASYPAVVSTNGSAINIFTGPFISSTYGIVPFLVTRMHYQITTGSYWEFRNNETTGALSPGPIAPAVRFYAPDTLLSPPSVSDVRSGITFASGSLVGTLRMPVASQVAYGVEVDNTTGSAIINAGDVWNYLISSITTTGSIGERLKNVSTISTTGQQLTTLNL